MLFYPFKKLQMRNSIKFTHLFAILIFIITLSCNNNEDNEIDLSTVVFSITPLNAKVNVETIFKIKGKNLPNKLSFSIENLEDINELPNGNDTIRSYKVILRTNIGIKAGIIKDSLGNSLYGFQILLEKAPENVYKGDLFLPTQEDIDSFNYTEVTGNLIIGKKEDNEKITNLKGLSSLCKIEKSLFFSGNTNIISYDGLQNLTTIGGDFIHKGSYYKNDKSLLTSLWR